MTTRHHSLTPTAACTAAFLLLFASAMASPAAAEAIITLRSGATLQGVATMDGNDVVVTIGESVLRTPFTSVASIHPANSRVQLAAPLPGQPIDAPANRGTELLVRALEAKLQADDSGSALGLLTEAYQAAPDDPRAAFWYANELIASGHGETAASVLRDHGEAITLAYPAFSTGLQTRLARRLELEKLPGELVERIDAINSAQVPSGGSGRRERSMYAYFRVIDADEKPAARNDFRVSVSGNHEELESFDRGYFLFSYTTSSGSHSPCKLTFQGENLKPAEHEFDATAWRARDAGVITAERYREEDRQQVAVRVVNAEGEPIKGASVSLRRVSGRTHSPQDATTDADGRALFKAYPGQYSAQANASGLRGSYKTTHVATGRDSKVTIKLFEARSATLRVKWKNVPADAQQSAVTGENAVTLVNGASRAMNYGSELPGLVQIEDKVAIAVGGRRYNRYSNLPAGEDWIVVLNPSEEQAEQTPQELYDSIDLESLDNRKADGAVPTKLSSRRYANDAYGYYAVEPGDVVIGVTTTMDPRNGRPARRTFKAIIAESE